MAKPEKLNVFWRNPDRPSSTYGILSCGNFLRNEGYSHQRPHGSGDWLVIYTSAGSGRILNKSGGMSLTKPGDALLFAPEEFQDYGTALAGAEREMEIRPETLNVPGTHNVSQAKDSRWHLQWAHFMPRPHWLPWLRWPLNDKGLRIQQLEEGEAREEFARAMLRMVHFSRRPLPAAQDLAANALERALLWVVAAASRRGMDARVQQAVDYLAAHSTEPFNLGDVARKCGLSVSRLSCLFRQQTGATPQQFHETQRLALAAQLLRLTNLTIGEIAGDVGYEDPFYFSNRFYRMYKKRPSVFRSEAASS